jgi:hypothetical protein
MGVTSIVAVFSTIAACDQGNADEAPAASGGAAGSGGRPASELECNCESQPLLCQTPSTSICSLNGAMTPPTLEEVLEFGRFKPGIVCGGYYECGDGTRRFGWAISFEGSCELAFDAGGRLVYQAVESKSLCGAAPPEVDCRWCSLCRHNPVASDAGAGGEGGGPSTGNAGPCLVDENGNSVMPD